MAAMLALSDATIVTPDGQTIPHAHLLSRDGLLRIRAEGFTDVSAPGVSYVERVSKTVWAVTTAEGVFTATKQGCGCS